MTEIKTWDDLVEIAAQGAWEGTRSTDGLPWVMLDERGRSEERKEYDAALRALRAAGIGFVPREATELMVMAGGRVQSQSIGCYGEPRLVISAALTAGEIKPEGE